MSHSRHVLVTGGAGYVGSALVPRLLGQGHKVTVLDLYLYGREALDGVRGNPDLREIEGADSNSVANTTSAQRAGEVDAEATTEADSGSRDRSAAERRLGRAGDRAGAWPLAQRDQYGDRARP